MQNKKSKILITGANGLVGKALTDELENRGYENVFCVTREKCDLLDTHETASLFEREEPEFVFHAAAKVYGIMGNMKNKALSFYDNVMINTNVIDAAQKVQVKKITAMGTGAIYPFPSPSLPLKESDIFMGRPHGAENSYAHAKRAMLAMLEAYEESFDLEWAYVVSCNLFGPHDTFDTNFGHVVPSLVKKFYDAKQKNSNVEVWGDGSAQRDFLYVKDTASVVIDIMQNCAGAVNIGSGRVYSIKQIVDMLAEISGMQGHVVWDSSKPNGQDYRAYDLSKVRDMGFVPEHTIYQGLEETWEWYCENNKG